jgi:hypothetical protein
MLNFSPSPDGSKYPFMSEFGIKDTVDSGREAVMKNYCYAPKKKHQLDRCFDYNYLLKMTFSCSSTLMKVVLLVNSFNLEAPT